MKKTSFATLILLILAGFTGNSYAQRDTAQNKTILKIMTIVNGDTTMTEKTITGGNNGSFQIFNDGTEINFDFSPNTTDSLFNAMMNMFNDFNTSDMFKGFDFSFDTLSLKNFKLPFPDSILKPGKQIYPKDQRDRVKRTPVSRNIAVEDFSSNNKLSSLASVFTVIPDPADGTFTVFFPRDHKKESTLQISPLEGNTSYKEIIESGKSAFQRRFDLRDYPSGIYIISLKQGKQSASKKLVIQ